MVCALRFLIIAALILQSGIVFAEDGRFALQFGGVAPKAGACDQDGYSDFKEWSQNQLGNYKSCLKNKTLAKDSKVSLLNTQAFEASCNLKRDQALSMGNDLNNALEQSFWQDIASKSARQAACRSQFFDEYLEKPTQTKKLNDKVRSSFNQYKQRLAELGEYRAQQAKSLKEWENANNSSGRGLFKERVDGNKALLASIDKEIAGILSQIPMGYEPEVGARIVAMAMNDSFDEKAFYDGMSWARGKYDKSADFYCQKHSAGCHKKGEKPKSGTYCLDLDYKNFAASSGQTDILIGSYKTLDAKDRAILQCRISSRYKVGQDRLNYTMAGAFVVGGLLAAIPTSGTSLGVSLAAIGIGASSLGFIDQLNVVRQKCALQTYIISGEEKQCNPEQDFNSAMDSSTMSSCLANVGLLALGSVEIPLNISSLVKSRRLAKLAATAKAEKVADEIAVASKSDYVAPEDETIVSTAPRKAKRVVASNKKQTTGDLKSDLDSTLGRYGDVNSEIEKLNTNLDEALKNYSVSDRAKIKKLHSELVAKGGEQAKRNVDADLLKLKQEAEIKKADCGAFNKLKDPAFSSKAKCSVVTFTKDSSRYCSCGAKGKPGAWVAPCAEAVSGYLTKGAIVNDKALPGSSAAGLNECRRILIPKGTTVIHGGAGPAFSGYGGDAQIFLGMGDSFSGRANMATRIKAAELNIIDVTTKFDTQPRVIAFSPQHDDLGMRKLYDYGRQCHGGGKGACTDGDIQKIEKGFNDILATRPQAVRQGEAEQFSEWVDWLKGCRSLKANGSVSEKNMALPQCR